MQSLALVRLFVEHVFVLLLPAMTNYGVAPSSQAIYSYTGRATEHLSLDLGDTVQVLEECAGRMSIAIEKEVLKWLTCSPLSLLQDGIVVCA